VRGVNRFDGSSSLLLPLSYLSSPLSLPCSDPFSISFDSPTPSSLPLTLSPHPEVFPANLNSSSNNKLSARSLKPLKPLQRVNLGSSTLLEEQRERWRGGRLRVLVRRCVLSVLLLVFLPVSLRYVELTGSRPDRRAQLSTAELAAPIERRDSTPIPSAATPSRTSTDSQQGTPNLPGGFGVARAEDWGGDLIDVENDDADWSASSFSLLPSPFPSPLLPSPSFPSPRKAALTIPSPETDEYESGQPRPAAADPIAARRGRKRVRLGVGRREHSSWGWRVKVRLCGCRWVCLLSLFLLPLHWALTV
jgi:hypothetical protein